MKLTRVFGVSVKSLLEREQESLSNVDLKDAIPAIVEKCVEQIRQRGDSDFSLSPSGVLKNIFPPRSHLRRYFSTVRRETMHRFVQETGGPRR